MITLRGKIFLSAISGILLFLSFPPYNFNWFAFFALIPLLICIESSSYKLTIILSLVFSTVFYIGLLHWIYVYNIIALPGIILILNVYNLVLFLLYKFLKERLPFFSVFIFSIVWVSIEYFRGTGLFGFPWGILGYSQYNFLQFIQISDIVGVFGISFFICLINSIITNLVITRFTVNYFIIQSILILILIFFVLLYGFDKFDEMKKQSSNNIIRIGFIQPNFFPYSSWENNRDKRMNLMYNKLNKLIFQSPDIIVLSETIFLDPLFEFDLIEQKLKWRNYWLSYKIKHNLQEFLSMSNSFLLFGTQTSKILSNGKTNYYNSSVFLSPNCNVVDSYNKIHLVPFGEFVPFYNKYDFIKIISQKFGCSNFDFGNEIKVFSYDNYKFSTLICYESIFHNLSRKFVKSGADFLINITNDAWTLSKSAHLQHFYMNVFSSVQNHVSLFRVGNSGVSAFINPIGQVIYSTEPMVYHDDIVNFKVYPSFKGSFYSRYGDIFAQLVVLILGFLFFVSFFFSKNNDSFF